MGRDALGLAFLLATSGYFHTTTDNDAPTTSYTLLGASSECSGPPFHQPFVFCGRNKCAPTIACLPKGDGAEDKVDLRSCPATYAPTSYHKDPHLQVKERTWYFFGTKIGTTMSTDRMAQKCWHQDTFNPNCSRDTYDEYAKDCNDIIVCGYDQCYKNSYIQAEYNKYPDPSTVDLIPDLDGIFTPLLRDCPVAYYKVHPVTGRSDSDPIGGRLGNTVHRCKRCILQPETDCAEHHEWCLGNRAGQTYPTAYQFNPIQMGCKTAVRGKYADADGIVHACNRVPHSYHSVVQCTNAVDSIVSGCDSGFFDNRTAVATGPSICTPCVNQEGCAEKLDSSLYGDECMCQNQRLGRCPWDQLNHPRTVAQCAQAAPGYYIDTDAFVRPCTGNVTHAAANATYTCTNAMNSVPSACAPGYVVAETECINRNSSDTP